MTVAVPIVVDLGKISDQAIDELLGGGGQIIDDIEEVLKLIRVRADLPVGNRLFLPVVAVFRRKRTGAAAVEIGSSVVRSEEAP